MSVFKYEKDADGIVTITMDMTGPVNAMNAEFRDAMGATVDRLEAEQGLSGVVFASAKKVFFAGGDLKELLAFKKGEEANFMGMLDTMKSFFRKLEKLPVPVVSAINGAALGGGYELCLATNYRLAWNDKSVQIGLPEVTLGLLPGGGGVVRLVNLLGLQAALPYLLEGKKVTPEAALKAGMIDEVVDSLEQLLPRAKAYILANKGNQDAAIQPWDKKDFRIPGGNASSPKLAQVLMGAPAMLAQKTRGLLPAPEQILDCAIEAARLDFEAAQRIETRGLTYLVGTPEAKNLITTFFFQMNKVNSGASRPKDVAPQLTKKVGVLGAGMMGQGIAYVSAMAGIEVILKDISVEAAEKGKAYSEKLLDKAMARGRMSPEKKAQVLGLIKPTADNADLQGCDLIIEAVFENIALKNKITSSTEQYLCEGGIWGSNTSTLPITQLAEAASKPENFIGVHFFSPVDKMPLVELICGEKTSDIALAKAFDYARQIKKTPIVVNDSLGFFTSRTFGTYFDEGARMVVEGVAPIKVDNLGKAIGMPVGPLTVHDEVSQELSRKAMETWAEMGVTDKWGEQDALREVVDFLVVQNGRGGRHHNGGYFDYRDGNKTLWAGVVEKFYKADVCMPDQDIKDRLLFRQVIETLKCLQTNVLRTVADGNIGSIMGIGAPIWTGGFLQFVNTYGLERFQTRCGELAAQYGERFACPEIVAQKIAAGETFV
ncbi:3-hydroxyacyl-CoA dehydrogenase / enoyl-CoA hydratase / 3-hydroxybutyryl-CoA epimerase [Pseudomonas pohangensis]|uniref:3-hydroxyacyl-CoA dehydrogenase / enoyl-CoA hydratase / 3-hydroxybutyryl-CoA epimerase n=2 Tax=Pseudomonas pohangensis TaxID=364197 RepID=A0A1H2FAN0_9PSED|nr:3-hydroxyacyl-CoA dehydrogenase NAD-binding domain-containing protein [Pseudomonas pohangensis]SDU04313.1 3-hydroxyacyl-CoA dehydrogenase / enoyl-CoA hydratase / 3-hydroxybutyryl-CoA epimerase [Pseudomonas pohangensis]